MHNLKRRIISRISRTSALGGLSSLVGGLLVTYVGLMAFTMSYAVVHTQYAQQARDESGRIGNLEANYFTALAKVDSVDPTALGYKKPATRLFATLPSATAVATAQQ
jgi:hypothetical protein